RRHFDRRLEAETNRALRAEHLLALLMLDVDRFKLYNDRYGHAVGDEVLKAVASAVKQAVRLYDVPTRYGGDEFAVILPDADTEAATRVARRILEKTELASLPVELLAEHEHLGLSIGVATFPRPAGDANGLVEAADAAMYRAKQSGGGIRVWEHSLGDGPRGAMRSRTMNLPPAPYLADPSRLATSELQQLVPNGLASEFNALVVGRDGQVLTVALPQPNPSAADAISKATGFAVYPVFSNSADVRVVAPDTFEDLLLRQHAPGIGHEVTEQLELGRREMHGNAVGLHLMRRLIEDEVAGLVDRGCWSPARSHRAPQDRLHSRDELLQPERFGDVVVRAELQPAQDVALVLTRGKKQHGDVLVVVADALEHDEDRELRTLDVEDHQVRLLTRDRFHRALAVVRPRDVVALAAERVFEELDEVAIVVDDQQLQELPASSASCRPFGTVKCTDVPCPGPLSLAMLPPWACTIALQSERPRPSPPACSRTVRERKKRWKRRFCSSNGMPGPSSATVTRT